jgi:hypothetical protein
MLDNVTQPALKSIFWNLVPKTQRLAIFNAVTWPEVVRQRNAANAKKYYETKIKTDPEKYNKFLNKCRAPSPNRKYYHLKQMTIEDELTNPVIVEI